MTTTKTRWESFQSWINDSGSPWGIFRAEAIEAMKLLPDESVDLILSDIAYESMEKHRKRGTTTRLKQSKASSNRWFPIFPNERIPEFLYECYRVLAPDSHCYLFCDDETSDIFRIAVAAMNQERGKKDSFKWWKRIVWDKKKIGMGYHWRATYEFVIFLEKGKRPLNHKGWSDVRRHEKITTKALGRDPEPAEKPVGLCSDLILNSTKPGQLILDPFCGSGSAGEAALTHKREFLGFDIDPKAIRFSRRRMKGLAA